MKTTTCPSCGREWPYVSEQAAAITLIHHCIVCEVRAEASNETLDLQRLIARLDKDGITAERIRRAEKAGYDVDPCPRCLQGRDKNCAICHGLGAVKVDVRTKEKSIKDGNSHDDE